MMRRLGTVLMLLALPTCGMGGGLPDREKGFLFVLLRAIGVGGG